jgi:hypothetical protein
MRRPSIRVVGAALLIIVGILTLLQRLGIAQDGLDLIWMLLFLAGSGLFIYLFVTNRANWWAVIPGFGLAALGAIIAIEWLAPNLQADWGGIIFTLTIALSFLIVYLNNREHWWAVIPGGVMLTIAVTVVLTELFSVEDAGGVFFIGLGLTFCLLYLTPSPEGRMSWALIPGAVLAVLGVVMLAAAVPAMNLVWPIALILGGVFFVFQALRSR